MMNDKNLNSKAPEIRRILPVMLKVENLHIHLDERSTSNTYFNGVEEEEPDIDIEAMIDAIAAKTGLCKQSIMMVLDAQAEYLDSVCGEDDEVDEDGIRHRKFWKNEKNWQRSVFIKRTGSITSSTAKYSVENVVLPFCAGL